MNYIITLSSKNKTSLTKFFQFFNKDFLTFANHSVVVIAYKQKTKARKTISVLKSPHVNKTAQVHFSTQTFSKQMVIFSYKPNKFFLFLKQVQSRLFPDIVMKLKLFIKSNHSNQLLSKFLSPNNFTLDITKLDSKQQKLKRNRTSITPPIKGLMSAEKKNNTKSYKMLCNKVINYLKIWDCYGESVFLNFQNKCLDSSVGRAKD